MTRNDALREARIQRHWTQSTLAVQLNTTRVTVVRWEQGKTLPSLYFRKQLCQLFEMTEQALGLGQDLVEMQQSQVWSVPETRNRFFTARETLLQQLHANLARETASDTSGIHVISGLAGIGKTQVALEYAYRFRQHYAVIAWVRAETHETLLADLIHLAMTLGLLDVSEQEEARVVPALSMWLSMHSNWLLLLDNVEDFALVSRMLPIHDPQGRVLITTRIQATGRLNHLDLKEMSTEEAMLFFLRRAKLLPIHCNMEQISAEERVLAAQLCQELGGLPLALEQAGSYIEETGCSIAGYLERLKCRCSALLSWRAQQSGGYPYSVVEVFRMVREHVERRSLVASELLYLCLFLHPDTIPELVITHSTTYLGRSIQEAATDLLSLDEAFAVLNACSLLRRNPETHLLTIHRLVQAVLRDQLEAATQQLWLERALQALLHLFPINSLYEVTVWPLCELLLPHISYCIEHIKHLACSEHHAYLASIGSTLLLNVVDYLLERERYTEAHVHLEHAFTLFRYIDDPRYLSLGHTLGTLARRYENLGRYSESEALKQCMLAMQHKILEKSDFQIANAPHILPLLYGQSGKYTNV